MDKDLQYRLGADSREFDRGFKSAEASARALERELARLEAQQAKVDHAMQSVGVGMLAAGGAIAAGLYMAAKAAASWESAWVGVRKVVNGTPEQLADLESQLRGLARVLPQTHEEIAGVAAAAGQLGIARDDIVEFTKVMVALGVATDLTSEQAAFALARLMNIMQTAPENVDRLGASLVALGNNFAATESEITEMAVRIAGAGHTVRMSEADVFGFAAALSAVGIDAEAGGSAISRAFINIEGAVRKGGKALDLFADVSGMTADQFKQAWMTDSAAAMNSFVQGLGRIQRSGGDVFRVLSQAGMSEIRLRDAMLRLAGAGNLLGRALDTSNDGWRDNTALLNEANQRYQTTASKLQIARNNLNDFAIDMGNVLLPVVGEAADLVANLGGALGELPAPFKAVLAVLGATSAALLLAGGAALIAVPKIAAYRAAVETLINSEGRLATATLAASNTLGRVGSFLSGPWGAAIGLAVAAITAFGIAQAEARGRAKELSDTLDEQNGAVTRDTAVWVANELTKRDLIDNAERLGISAADLTEAILGQGDALERVNEILRRNSERTVTYGGATAEANGDVAKLRTGITELTGDLDAAQKLHSQLDKAMQGQTKTVEDLDPATRQLAGSLSLTADEADDLSKELTNLDKALKALFGSLFNVEEAQDAATVAMQKLVAEAKKNHGALTGNSEAALTNRDNVRKLIQSHMDLISAYAGAGATSEELNTKTQELKKQFIDQALKAGLSKKAVLEYADAYDQIPATVESTITVKAPGLPKVNSQLDHVNNMLDRIDGKTVTATVRTVFGEFRAGERNPSANRWGGLYEHAQDGLLRDAGIYSATSPARYAYAEAATGGEAFIPRLGDEDRKRRIWEYVGRNWITPRSPAPQPIPSASSAAGHAFTPEANARAIRQALMGMAVVMNGRLVGELQGREADRLGRGG